MFLYCTYDIFLFIFLLAWNTDVGITCYHHHCTVPIKVILIPFISDEWIFICCISAGWDFFLVTTTGKQQDDRRWGTE